MLDFNPEDFLPFFALSIPIIAIIGGITAGIVKMIQRQRSFEMIQRERIAAIERGLDPDKIASMQRPMMYDDGGIVTDPLVQYGQLRQGLTIGGIVTLFVGVALAVFLRGVTANHNGDDSNAWLVGLIPASVGVALLICSAIIRPIQRTPHTPIK